MFLTFSSRSSQGKNSTIFDHFVKMAIFVTLGMSVISGIRGLGSRDLKNHENGSFGRISWDPEKVRFWAIFDRFRTLFLDPVFGPKMAIYPPSSVLQHVRKQVQNRPQNGPPKRSKQVQKRPFLTILDGFVIPCCTVQVANALLLRVLEHRPQDSPEQPPNHENRPKSTKSTLKSAVFDHFGTLSRPWPVLSPTTGSTGISAVRVQASPGSKMAQNGQNGSKTVDFMAQTRQTRISAL